MTGTSPPDRHPLIQHRLDSGGLQPGGAPGTEGQLAGDLSEGPPSTGNLGAQEPRLDDYQLDVLAADPEVLDPLTGALMHPGRDHPTVRAGRLTAVGRGDDPAATHRQITR